MTKKQINVAVIGSKFMGKAHSNAFRKINFFFPDFPAQIVQKVLCSTKRAELEEIGPRYGFEEISTDWKKTVARDDVDVVSICSPGNNHHPMALAALAAGKHVICEKPLANSLEQAREMVKAANKAGVKTLCAFNYRFAPAVTLARQIIDEGRIGRIHHFRAAYQQSWLLSPDVPLLWRLKKKTAGFGVLGDLGAHIIDLARFLVGEFDSVSAAMETFIKERPLADDVSGIIGGRKAKAQKGRVDVDDASVFLARFGEGALGTFEVTRFAAGCKNRNHFELYGEKGAIRWNLERMNYLQFFDNSAPDHLQGFNGILVTEPCHPYLQAWWPPGHNLGYEHLFVHEMLGFFEAVADERKSVSPNFDDGLACQAIMETVAKSAKSKKWEKVPKR